MDENKKVQLPLSPSGWYRFESSTNIKKNKIYTYNYFSTSFICFRDTAGLVHIFDAYCPHLGAHLGKGGKIENNILTCPFHGWKYDISGKCIAIPYCKQIPKKAKLIRYPSQEFHSSIYFYFSHDAHTIETAALKPSNNFFSNNKVKYFFTTKTNHISFQQFIDKNNVTPLNIKTDEPAVFFFLRPKPVYITQTPIDDKTVKISFALSSRKVINPFSVFILKQNLKKNLHYIE